MWALLMRNRDVRQARKAAADALSRVHRLEIQHGELLDSVNALNKRVNSLSGHLGGRPRKGAPPNQLDLESIPRGDKEGLRAYFKLHPPKE